MRLRTFAGILFALAVVVSVSYFSNQNQGLLNQRFALTPTTSAPLYGVLIAVFLCGFLPAVSVLLTQSLRRDLEERRERRLDRDARSLRVGFRRAIDFRADGQWGKAIKELEALQTEQPENFGTLLCYGEALRESGRVEEAIEVHRRLSVLYPQGVAALYELAKDYAANGDQPVADQIHDRILRDFPGQGLSITRRRRDEAMESGDWSLAGQLQERVDGFLQEGGVGPDEREARVRRGLEYQTAAAWVAEERYDAAVERLDSILAEAPDFLPAVILRGEGLLASGDEEGALRAWREGFLDSGRPVFLQRIEDHFIERENPLEAIENLHELIGGAENDLLPRFFLGRLYYRLEMHDEAFKILSVLEGRFRSSPTYHYLMGRIFERRGDEGAAADAFRAALRESGVRRTEYFCTQCGERRGDWTDRCGRCGRWNSVELDFEEDRISPEALGIRERPVWVVDDGVDGA